MDLVFTKHSNQQLRELAQFITSLQQNMQLITLSHVPVG